MSIFRSLFSVTALERPSLHGLRALSILGILLHHFVGSVLELQVFPVGDLSRRFFDHTYSFLDFFFVLSGFLIAGILQKEEDRAGQVRLWDFLKARALRIFPAYYFFLFVHLIIVVYLFRGQVLDSNDLAFRFSMDFFFLNNHIPRFLATQAWSLSLEIQFYLFFAVVFVLFYAKASSRNRLAFIGLLFVIVFALRAWISIQNVTTALELQQKVYLPFYTRIDSLFMGVLVFEASRRTSFLSFVDRFQIPILIGAIGLFMGGHLIPFESHSILPALRHSVFSFSCGLFLSVALVEGSFTKLFSWDGWTPIARLSFSMYLYHILTLGYVLGKFASYITSWLSLVLVFFLAVVFTALVSFLFYLFTELPFQAIRKKAFATPSSLLCKLLDFYLFAWCILPLLPITLLDANVTEMVRVALIGCSFLCLLGFSLLQRFAYNQGYKSWGQKMLQPRT